MIFFSSPSHRDTRSKYTREPLPGVKGHPLKRKNIGGRKKSQSDYYPLLSFPPFLFFFSFLFIDFRLEWFLRKSKYQRRLRALYFTPIHSSGNWGKYRGIVSRKLTVATVFMQDAWVITKGSVWYRVDVKQGGENWRALEIERNDDVYTFWSHEVGSKSVDFFEGVTVYFYREFYELKRILYLFTLCFSTSFTLWETRGVKIRPVVYLGSLQSASTAQYPMQIRG